MIAVRLASGSSGQRSISIAKRGSIPLGPIGPTALLPIGNKLAEPAGFKSRVPTKLERGSEICDIRLVFGGFSSPSSSTPHVARPDVAEPSIGSGRVPAGTLAPPHANRSRTYHSFMACRWEPSIDNQRAELKLDRIEASSAFELCSRVRFWSGCFLGHHPSTRWNGPPRNALPKAVAPSNSATRPSSAAVYAGPLMPSQRRMVVSTIAIWSGRKTPKRRISFTVGIVMMFCASNAPVFRNWTFDCTSNRDCRVLVVCGMRLVKTRSFGSSAEMLITKHGRTFATIPKSTSHTSLRAGVVATQFLRIERLKQLVR
jgi:hypothetical protein